MFQLIDPVVKDVRNRASVMHIVHNMIEVLKVFRASPMLALDEQAHMNTAYNALSALLDLWIDDVEIELSVQPPAKFTLTSPKVKGLFPKHRERNVNERAQKRAATALLEMLAIFHDEQRMRQEDYTVGQQGHILVALQNILDALEQFEPKVKHKLGLLAEQAPEEHDANHAPLPGGTE